MKDIFEDILGIDGVHGAFVISGEGGVTMSRFSASFKEKETRIGQANWSPLIIELEGIAEAELIYETARLYARKAEAGYLFIVMGDAAPISLIRLNCDVLIPALDRMKPAGKRISALLRKKIF